MPPIIKQTLKQAKAQYRKNGPQMSEKERRQLKRGAELDRRAEAIKDRERQRKIAQKKRREKEEREREARRKNGFGLATQIAGYSHTQKQLKGFMESFVGFKKDRAERAPATRDDSGINSDAWKSSPVEESADFSGEEAAHGHSLATPPMQRTVQIDSAGEDADPWDDDDLDGESIFATLKDKTPTSKTTRKTSQAAPVRSLIPTSPVARAPSDTTSRAEITSPGDALPALDDDFWDDLLVSNTQIERELSSPVRAPSKAPAVSPVSVSSSAEEFDLSAEGLKDLESSWMLLQPPSTTSTRTAPTKSMPPPKRKASPMDDDVLPPSKLTTAMKEMAPLKKKISEPYSKMLPQLKAPVTAKKMPPPARRRVTPSKRTVTPSPSKSTSLADIGLSTQLLCDAVDLDVFLTP